MKKLVVANLLDDGLHFSPSGSIQCSGYTFSVASVLVQNERLRYRHLDRTRTVRKGNRITLKQHCQRIGTEAQRCTSSLERERERY
jgi:hypothetical protein